MRIDGLEYRQLDGFHRLSAWIHWEDSARPPFEMCFEVPEWAELPPERVIDPFVLAAYTRAFDCGERRVAADEPIADGLHNSMRSALAILKHWGRRNFGDKALPQIEVPVRTPRLACGEEVAAFYSGGVDSTHLLLANHDEFPAGVDGRARHALAIYGLDMGKTERKDQRPVFSRFLDGALPLINALEMSLVPIYTNQRHLDPRLRWFPELGSGFDLAACATLFPSRVGTVLVANPGERLSDTVQFPLSVHPIIHQYLSSRTVVVRAPYVEVSRLERIDRISRTPSAVEALRVCFFSEETALNCGRCEKCVRTLLGFKVAGLAAPSCFPAPVTPAMIDAVDVISEGGAEMHRELMDRLEALGEQELMQAERRLQQRWLHTRRRVAGTDLKGRLKRLDQRLCGGRGVSLLKTVIRRSRASRSELAR